MTNILILRTTIAILNDLSVGLRGGTPYGGVAPKPPNLFFSHFTCDCYGIDDRVNSDNFRTCHLLCCG